MKVSNEEMAVDDVLLLAMSQGSQVSPSGPCIT